MVRLSCFPKTHRFPLHLYGYDDFERLDHKFHYWNPATTNLILGNGFKYLNEKLDGEAREIIINSYQVFYEDVRKRRIVPYEELTRCDYVFAVWDTHRNKWLSFQGLMWFLEEYGLSQNPLISTTNEVITIDELVELLNTTSRFNKNHLPEGIIVVNDTIKMRGKVVNPLYDDTFENMETLKLDLGENKLS